MSKHTPGPWTVDGAEVRTDGNRRYSLTESANLCIARCSSDQGEAGDAQANARLIAAAPEMLSVLKELMARRDKCFIPSEDGLDQRILAAIAKAEGRSNG